MSDNVSYTPAWSAVSSLAPTTELSVDMGCKLVDHRVIASQSGNSSSSMSFQWQVPKDMVLSPVIWCTMPTQFDVRFTTAAAAATVAALGLFADKANWCFANQAPIRWMDRVKLSIGGRSIDRESSDLAAALAPLYSVDDPILSSSFPTLDNVSQFADAGLLSPFGSVQANANMRAPPRTNADVVVTYHDATDAAVTAFADATPYTARIRTTFRVPIPLDLFATTGGRGLAYAGQVNISISLHNRIRELIKVRPATVQHQLNGVEARFTAEPQLYYNTVLPHDSIREKSLAVDQCYPYTNYATRKQTKVTLPAGGSARVITNSVAVGVVPQRVIISCPAVHDQRSVQDEMLRPNFYGKISKLTVQLSGHTIMTSASAFDLWRISTRNGSNQTWQEFESAGGIIVLSLADCDMPSGEKFVGALHDGEISVQFDLTNASAEAQVYEPYLILSNTDILRLSPSDSQISSHVALNEAGVKELFNDFRNMADAIPTRIGGGIGSFLKSGFNKVLDLAPKVIGIGKQGFDLYRSLRGGANGGFVPPANITGGAAGKPKRGGGVDDAGVKSRIL